MVRFSKTQLSEEEIFQMHRAAQSVRMGVNAVAGDALYWYIMYRILSVSHVAAGLAALGIGARSSGSLALVLFAVYVLFSFTYQKTAVLFCMVLWIIGLSLPPVTP